MANDLASLTTLIQGDLIRTDITTAQIQTMIRWSVREYENTRFHFNEKVLTVNSVANIPSYTLASFAAMGLGTNDIIEVDDLSTTVSTRNYDVDEISWSRYSDLQVSATRTGYPSKYAIFDQQVWIYPTPNAVYPLVMTAHVKFTDLTNVGDSNPWTNEARELIRCATTKRIWGVLQRDPDQAQVGAMGEQLALASLLRKTGSLSGHTVDAYL